MFIAELAKPGFQANGIYRHCARDYCRRVGTHGADAARDCEIAHGAGRHRLWDDGTSATIMITSPSDPMERRVSRRQGGTACRAKIVNERSEIVPRGQGR